MSVSRVTTKVMPIAVCGGHRELSASKAAGDALIAQLTRLVVGRQLSQVG